MRAIITGFFLCLLISIPTHGQQTHTQGGRLPDNPARSGLSSLDSLLFHMFQRDTLYNDTVEALHPLEWSSVFQDEKISFLLHAHREAMMDRLGIPGFRVHLYMDSGNRARLNTQHEQAAFEEKYPDQAAYIIYEEPYFKLRAGDFRTRLDARRFLEKIRRDYPAAYIVVDLINYPEMN